MKRRITVLTVCLLLGSLLLTTLPSGVQATVNPTGIGLAEFALKAWREGWGYVYGTYGQMMTQTLIDAKARQYPQVYAEIMSDGRTAYQHAQEWIGGRAADCVGLIKAFLWWQGDSAGPSYSSAQDRSANGMYAAATVKGPIETIPDIQGLLLWRDGHIGIYLGNGEVIESRGVEYGVVKTRLTDRNWTNWCQAPSVSYLANGWTTFDSQTYYYRNGTYQTGLQEIDSRLYLLGSNGILQTGFQPVNGEWRYFPADGARLTGWQTIQGARYYLNESGAALTGWQTLDDRKYLFNPQGVLLTGWQEIGQDIFYLDQAGSPLTGSRTIGSRQLTFAADGRLLTGWQTDNGQTSYYHLNGEKATGVQLIGGNIYGFDDSGIRLDGWQTIDGWKYYFSPADGAALTGLQFLESQSWLFGKDGRLANEAGFSFMDDRIYLGNADGQALSGIQSLSGYADLDPTPVTLNLEFAADDALNLRNQEQFGLGQSEVVLIKGAEPDASARMTIDAAQPGAQWLSLDPSVVSVDSSGLVTARGIGRTLIVYLTDTGKYACAQVTVLPDPAELAQPDGVLLLEPGVSADLAIGGLPAGLLNACQLTSSDPAALSVAADGRLTALGAGNARITVRFGAETVWTLDVQVRVPLLGLMASQPVLNLAVGGCALSFAVPVPAAAGTDGISYLSAAPEVAEIGAAGSIAGRSAGSALATAQAGECLVNVQVQVDPVYSTLRPGSSGEQVRQMQLRLASLGYPAGSADGLYGPQTTFAICALQKKLNLPITGQADHDLLIALQNPSAPTATALQVPGMLRPGDGGEAVFILQQRLYELNILKTKPDGQYLDQTRQAVTTLLILNNRTMTDWAGPETLSLLFSRTVKAGKATLTTADSGYEVLLLQTRLKELGYYAGPLDGVFSSAVLSAVSSFQDICGLTADGEAGPLTQGRLFAADAPVRQPESATPAPEAPTGPVTLNQGSQGAAVLALEQRLIALGYLCDLADSAYGSLTVQAVRAFQQRAGLAQNGIADLQTQNRLNAITAPRSAVSYRRGSRGDAVSRIQARLNQLGFSCGAADGSFGSRTYSAARAFQARKGLVADGIVGSRTIAVLFSGSGSSLAPSAGSASPTVNRPAAPVSPTAVTYRLGSRGEGVRNLQNRLNQLGYRCGTADGSFGSMTLAAVKAFQRRAGLTVDGIAGIRTQTALYASNAPAAR